MRLLFALPGFHRHDRGAEVALLAIAEACANSGDTVTVMGSGLERPSAPYRFIHVPSVRRERLEFLPSVPLFRTDTAYEEATFGLGLAFRYNPARFDLTVTCSFPFTNILLRRPRIFGQRPKHVFVTQNGDWPAITRTAEYGLFSCDGLVCTNPDFYDRNRQQWDCALIPNGTDLDRFSPGPADRRRFNLPGDKPVILMVSALIASKRVEDGIRAVAALSDAHLVVAGDGILRAEADALAGKLLPGRFSRITVAPTDMPDLYRSADVFLHMSELESFGNVFVEAMACDIPIVAHDTPRLRWIVGDEQPLVDTTNPDLVAAALRHTIEQRPKFARDRVARFGWDRVAADYREFFSNIAGRKAAVCSA